MANNFLSRWSQRKLNDTDAASDITTDTAFQAPVSETMDSARDEVLIDETLIGEALVDKASAGKALSDTAPSDKAHSDNVHNDNAPSDGDEACSEDASSELDTPHAADSEEAIEADPTGATEPTVAELLLSEVDASIKKKALRSLFMSGEFHEVDRLNDYDHDYKAVKSLSSDVVAKLRGWMKEVDEPETGAVLADDSDLETNADRETNADPDQSDVVDECEVASESEPQSFEAESIDSDLMDPKSSEVEHSECDIDSKKGSETK